MIDWIEIERHERIKAGEAKYGTWTPENFRLSGRTGIGEAIPEFLDAISYLEMSYQLAEISAGEFSYYKSILIGLIETLDRKRSKQK